MGRKTTETLRTQRISEGVWNTDKGGWEGLEFGEGRKPRSRWGHEEFGVLIKDLTSIHIVCIFN